MTAQDLPAVPGAYALILWLNDATPVSTAAHGPGTLPPGCYVYAGSARGPGGIRARVRRHLRPAKSPHWHIDQITARAAIARVVAWPGGSECGLVDGLRAQTEIIFPAPGFGSSDCRHCPAHLCRLPPMSVDQAADICRGVIGLARGDAPV